MRTKMIAVAAAVALGAGTMTTAAMAAHHGVPGGMSGAHPSFNTGAHTNFSVGARPNFAAGARPNFAAGARPNVAFNGNRHYRGGRYYGGDWGGVYGGLYAYEPSCGPYSYYNYPYGYPNNCYYGDCCSGPYADWGW